MVRRTSDERQGDLLELISRLKREEPTHGPGSLNVDVRMRASLSEALRHCDGDRFDVAARMSRLLDVEVTKWQLDAWTAESKEGHRFPAAYLPAFCVATADWSVMRLLAGASGKTLHTDPNTDVAAEIGRLEAEIAHDERALREKRKVLKTAVQTWQPRREVAHD